MTIAAKGIKIRGKDANQVDENVALLQDFLDKTSPDDVKRLLSAVQKNPNLVKKALKFM